MNKSVAGDWFLTLFIGALIGVAAWQATERTVLWSASSEATFDRPKLPDMRVNLNEATLAELSTLPGLGPGLARRIIDHRDQHGRFQSLEDLKRVSGIGPAIVGRIAPHAVVD